MSASPGRVALTIAGAAPLGAFEGGAVAALVTGLQPLCAGDDPDVRVDIVTGASSGAITGLLAARCLTRGADTAAVLHEAWVERASLGDLGGRGWHAPLSLDRVRRAATELMAGGHRDDPGRRQPEPVHVEVPLASLRGGPDPLTWSRFDLAPDTGPRQLAGALESVLAAAAEPVAFAARLVEPPGTDDDAGYYADGRLAAADPVLRAEELAAAAADGGGRRLVLVVDPLADPPAAGPAWTDPAVPPTWAATVRRSRRLPRRSPAGPRPDGVAVVSPDLLGAAPAGPGLSGLAGLAGLAPRERRRHDFDLGYRCGLHWLMSTDLAARLGVGDQAVSRARSAAADGYAVVRAEAPTSGPARRREAVAIARLGGRVAALAVHDAVLAHRRAQEPASRPRTSAATGGAPAGERWFHRQGTVFEATLRIESVVPSVLAALAPGGETVVAAHVRLSRFWPTGAGARFIGLALRLHQGERGDQDLILLSSGSTVVGRRLFQPTDSPLGTTFYSSVLGVSVAGERLLFGARPEGDAPPVPLDELLGRDEPGVTFRIEAARPAGSWYSVGLLDLELRRPDLDVRFRPTRTWPRVNAGLAGAIRDRFYVASQRSRAAGQVTGSFSVSVPVSAPTTQTTL